MFSRAGVGERLEGVTPQSRKRNGSFLSFFSPFFLFPFSFFFFPFPRFPLPGPNLRSLGIVPSTKTTPVGGMGGFGWRPDLAQGIILAVPFCCVTWGFPFLGGLRGQRVSRSAMTAGMIQAQDFYRLSLPQECRLSSAASTLVGFTEHALGCEGHCVFFSGIFRRAPLHNNLTDILRQLRILQGGSRLE